MCGFTGMSYHDSQKLSHMSQAIKQRAIDTEYFFETPHFSLYHAHLKISDLHLNTSQPYTTDNSIISFTGEIYNKPYLSDLLRISEDTSEIKLLSMLYEVYGKKFIEYINGEFSIAIYNKQQDSILLFRDRYGSKPIYYTFRDGELLFSTEIGSLIHKGSKVNKKHLLNYSIFSFGVSPDTFVKDIYIIPAGTYIIYKDKKIQSSKYLPYIQNEANIDFLSTLENAIKRRIPSHQPQVFIALSGGLDSNIIALYLKKYYTGKIIAYSFESTENNEDIEVAKYNAQKLEIQHYIINGNHLTNDMLAHESFVQLPDLYQAMKEYIPEYKGIKVEFGGDGKEELFQTNSHFNKKYIKKNIERYRKYLSVKTVNTDFLNTEMLDFNLQMIDKLSLRNGIERRMPFLDYELIKFKYYDNYNTDILEELLNNELRVSSKKYGYNDGIGFKILEQNITTRASKLLISLKDLYKN